MGGVGVKGYCFGNGDGLFAVLEERCYFLYDRAELVRGEGGGWHFGSGGCEWLGAWGD